jgi:hypothetical protein
MLFSLLPTSLEPKIFIFVGEHFNCLLF